MYSWHHSKFVFSRNFQCRVQWYILYAILNFIFLFKSKTKKKKVSLVLTTNKPGPEQPPFLNKFDFVGGCTMKHKTIKYARPHLYLYCSKDLINLKCSIAKHVIDCKHSKWWCALSNNHTIVNLRNDDCFICIHKTSLPQPFNHCLK